MVSPDHRPPSGGLCLSRYLRPIGTSPRSRGLTCSRSIGSWTGRMVWA